MTIKHLFVALLTAAAVVPRLSSALDQERCDNMYKNRPDGFDFFYIANFSQYDLILREDSSITLPQAGVYQGPGAFMEYVKFKTSKGDYFSYGPAINAYADTFNGYDSDTDTCEYLMAYQAEYHMDDKYATVAQQLNLTFMIKYQMGFFDGPVLKDAYVYYTTEWLNFLFDDMLNNDKVANYICDQLVNTCNNTRDGLPKTTCLGKFDNLPLVTSDRSHVDGNSKGCRELHVVMSSFAPEMHCPHIAFTPTRDPNGKFKCQNSLLLYPEDFFTQADFDFLTSLQESVGIDPTRGFKLKEEYEEESSAAIGDSSTPDQPNEDAGLNFLLDKARCDFMYKDRADGIDFFYIANFTQYDTILRNDSKIILPQAGIYEGPDHFMEYVKFKTSVGDYFTYGPAVNAYADTFNGYDEETDTCEYLMAYQAEYHMDDRFATVAQHLNLTFMIKYQMGYTEGPVLKNALVYYTSEWLTFLFDDMLNNDKVANYICDQMINSCNNTQDGAPLESCLAKFNELPLVSSDRAHVDGNSKGCRELHVVMAGFAPEFHCPHIAYTPTADPDGKVKCQKSLELQPEDYFTPEDFAFLEQLQRNVGVDPTRGFKLREEYAASDDEENDALAFNLDKIRCDTMYMNRVDGVDYFYIANFTQYDTILREDSSITLPQAGVYEGPDHFMEYVKFKTSIGDYFTYGPSINAYADRFNGYKEETDTCEYLMTYEAEYHMDDRLATVAQHLNLTFMIKYQMGYNEGPVLKKAFVYYTSEWLTFLFDDMLNNDKVANYICDRLVNNCNNTQDGEPRDLCLLKFRGLPLVSSDRAHVDGNSKGCRELHAVMAGFAPEMHCPHIAYTPTEDPNGKIKCQESLGLLPENYFSQDDFDFFEELQVSVGVDPARGFKLKEEYGTITSVESTEFLFDKQRCDAMYKDRADGIDYFYIANFTQYDTILRNDSKIILPQAGIYEGPDHFMEYVKFKTSVGDYFTYGPAVNAYADTFNGYDEETDTCEYLMAYQAEYHMDDRFATVAQHLNLTFMIKYQMGYTEGPVLKNALVYYTSEWLTFLFDDMLNNDKVANYICDQMINSCNNTQDGAPLESCLAKFNELPLASSDRAHVDGNSKGCRELHVVMAGFAPEYHCPHIAYTPTEDPNGKVKCQKSLELQPEDYFTPEDFAFLEQLQRNVGVDPARGFKLKEEYASSDGGQGSNTAMMFGITISAIVLALLLFVWLGRSKPTAPEYDKEDTSGDYSVQ